MIRHKQGFIILCFLFVLACGGGNTNTPPAEDNNSSDNTPAIADAGKSQLMKVNGTVFLDGSSSTDRERAPSSYFREIAQKPYGSSDSQPDAALITAREKPCSNNTECATGEFCRKAVGECDGAGYCKIKPELCTTLWNPMCGCDGLTYENPCAADAAGVSIAHTDSCTK